MINAKVRWEVKVVLRYCLHLDAVHHLLSHDTLLGKRFICAIDHDQQGDSSNSDIFGES